MFAGKIAKSQRTPGGNATSKLASGNLISGTRLFGGGAIEQNPFFQPTIAHPATSRQGQLDARAAAIDDTTLTDQHGSGSGAASPGGGLVSIGPVAVRNGPFHAPIDTPDTAGMEIAITLTSSTGVDADMAAVQDSEQVSLSYNHTGSFIGVPPLPSSQSGFMAGFPIPNDRHGTPKSLVIDQADNHGGDGSIDKDQLDIFTAPGSGVTSPTAIPNSGYQIRRIVKSGPGTKLVLRTEKNPKDCTVNGFTTAAGPSPTQAEEVVIRA